MNANRSATHRPSRPTAKLLAVSCLAAALIGSWVALPSTRRLTYRGKPADYYFPRWERSGNRIAESETWPVDAGADAVPFLVSVLRTEDSTARRLLVQHWDKLPSLVQDHLPTPRPADSIRWEAFEALLDVIRTHGGMPELSHRFDSLPSDAQEGFLRSFSSMRALTNETVPLLTTAFRGSLDQRRQAASLSLLALGRPAIELLPEIVLYLEQENARSGSASMPWAAYCGFLGRLGPEAEVAVPLLEKLKSRPDFKTRILASLALFRIEPHGKSFQHFFEDEVQPRGWSGLMDFFRVAAEQAEEFEIKQLLPPAEQVLPVLLPLLSDVSRTNIVSIGPGKDKTTAQDNLANLQASFIQQKTIFIIGSYGSNAAPAVPQLTQLLQHPTVNVRLATAHALQRIGPVAPESIPRVLSALSDGVLQEPLIDLLGGYGPLATSAVPDLKLIAAGQWQANWTNAPPDVQRLDRLMRERYGLIPKPELLQSAAKRALERIEISTHSSP